MSDRIVTIARFANSIEANLMAQLLGDAGIKAVLSGENAANMYAGLPFVANVELQVRESDAQKAIEIMKSHKWQEQ